MSWAPDEALPRFFRRLLGHVALITVLSSRQAEKLMALGFSPSQIAVVPNSCFIESLDRAVIREKHLHRSRKPTMKVLFLSNLIDSKGYPEFLGALEILSGLHHVLIDAVLCGRVIASPFNDRFGDAALAKDWIQESIRRINQSTGVKVRWVEGAYGSEKVALFQQSHVFVFPSRYPVEAQPIVLLEAMASGCAIITSSTGDILETVGSDSALILGSVSAEEVASAMMHLYQDPMTCSRSAEMGLELFERKFSLESHRRRWLDVLNLS